MYGIIKKKAGGERMDAIIKRISEMERIFDALSVAVRENPRKLKNDPETVQMLNALISYYEGGQWLKDYEADEKGLLPKDLKRGVLSEDGVYNLITELDME